MYFWFSQKQADFIRQLGGFEEGVIHNGRAYLVTEKTQGPQPAGLWPDYELQFI